MFWCWPTDALFVVSLRNAVEMLNVVYCTCTARTVISASYVTVMDCCMQLLVEGSKQQGILQNHMVQLDKVIIVIVIILITVNWFLKHPKVVKGPRMKWVEARCVRYSQMLDVKSNFSAEIWMSSESRCWYVVVHCMLFFYPSVIIRQ